MASSQQHHIEGSCEMDEIMIGEHKAEKPGSGIKNRWIVSPWMKRLRESIMLSGKGDR